jgi:hypothetical protein
MRRTLAIALAAGVLLIGGCAKQRDPAVPAPVPAASSAPAAAPAGDAPAADASSTAPATASSADDVDGLLDEVDRQLSSDGQPAADQD